MIRTMKVANLPRRMGKTTLLYALMKQVIKKEVIFLDEYTDGEVYDNLIIITSHRHTAEHFDELSSGRSNILTYTAEDFIRRNCRFGLDKTLVLLDEPFSIDEDIQAEIISKLEESRFELDVFAIGTKVKRRKIFKDYL